MHLKNKKKVRSASILDSTCEREWHLSYKERIVYGSQSVASIRLTLCQEIAYIPHVDAPEIQSTYMIYG